MLQGTAAAKVKLDLLRQKQMLMHEQIDKQKVNSSCLFVYVSVSMSEIVNVCLLSTSFDSSTGFRWNGALNLNFATSSTYQPPVWLVLFLCIFCHSLELAASRHSFL